MQKAVGIAQIILGKPDAPSLHAVTSTFTFGVWEEEDMSIPREVDGFWRLKLRTRARNS